MSLEEHGRALLSPETPDLPQALPLAPGLHSGNSGPGLCTGTSIQEGTQLVVTEPGAGVPDTRGVHTAHPEPLRHPACATNTGDRNAHACGQDQGAAVAQA